MNAIQSKTLDQARERLNRALDRMRTSDDSKEKIHDVTEALIHDEERKLDKIVSPTQILLTPDNKVLHVESDDDIIELERSKPFDQHVATYLGVPKNFYDKQFFSNPDIMADFTNALLQREEKPMLMRAFAPNGEPGKARALLSNGYKPIDHLPLVVSAVEALANSSYEVSIDSWDITDNRLYIRWSFPELRHNAVEALRNYHLPQDLVMGEKGIDFGGQLRNSETGAGAFSVEPRVIILVCGNGATVESDSLRTIHRGERKPMSFQWSARTRALNARLAGSEMRDMINAHTSPKWIEGKIASFQEASEQKITNLVDAPINMAKDLGLGEEAANTIRDNFLAHGDHSALGLMNAATLYAHRQQSDADVRYDIERKAFDLLAKASRYDAKPKHKTK